MSSVPKKPLERKASKAELQQVQDEASILEKEKEVLARGVVWSSWAHNQTITEQEKTFIENYCNNTLDARNDLVDEKPEYVALLVKTLAKIHKKEDAQYLLTLIEQLLQAAPAHSREFHKLGASAYEPFTRYLKLDNKESDMYCVDKSCKILSIIFSNEVPEGLEHVEKFLNFLQTRISDAKHSGRSLIQHLTALKDTLKRPANQLIWLKASGLERLLAVLPKENSNVQFLYLTGFIVWLLTMNKATYPYLRGGVIRELVAILKNAQREKVIRVSVAALRNLLDKQSGDHKFNQDMIGSGLHKVVQTISNRNWKDKDIEEELKPLQSKLELELELLSGFEMYVAEAEQGVFSWSPVHTEQFWRDNFNKFEHKEFALIQRLVNIVSETRDTTTLEVACYDLGEFARYYPDGKRVVEKLGGKLKVMMHMSSPDAGVRKQALLCVQKLMVSNWEFLNKGVGQKKGKAKN